MERKEIVHKGEHHSQLWEFHNDFTGVCGASHDSCVEAGGLYPECVLVDALRRQKRGRETRNEGQEEEGWEKKENRVGGMKGSKRRPCRTTLSPLTPLSQVSSRFVFRMSPLAGELHSTINKP